MFYCVVVDGDRVASSTCVTYVASSRLTFEFNDVVGVVDIVFGCVECFFGVIGFFYGYGKKCCVFGVVFFVLCARELCVFFDVDVLFRFSFRARRAMENKLYVVIKCEFCVF